ncbi:MAG: ATP synthase F1 subunit gamma [Sedimentisphaerales bacterium]|nr:ATP synthase F1 subunit gamma [Sedimentisphaerales bacterium]
MANAREIIRRRKSVSNICQITKTMEMISTSKFRKAYVKAVGARPYMELLTGLIQRLVDQAENPSHPLMLPNTKTKKTILLVLTSNRGLCGGFNGGLHRLAGQQLEKLREQEIPVDIYVSGKKGISHFKFTKQEVARTFTDMDEKAEYADIAALADDFIAQYIAGKIAKVRVIYMRFLSNSRHEPEILDILPLSGIHKAKTLVERQATEKVEIGDCIFSPSQKEILDEIIPDCVRSQLYQCVVDTVASEQGARMTAMQAATTNGEQMIDNLTREYNRVRQSQITSELLDIIGGSEALN